MDNNNFNIVTHQEFTKLIGEGIPYEYAFIMACEKGNQTELSKPLIDRMKQDQEILQRETFTNLVPFEPSSLVTTEASVIGFADDLDDGPCPSSGAEKNNNDL